MDQLGMVRGWARRAAIGLAAALCVTAVGCEGDDGHDGEHTHDTTTATGVCAGETRGDVYSPGMQVDGAAFHVRLASADPAPPQKGLNAWTLEVVDAAGAVLPGADITSITVKPFMTDHNHPSPDDPTIMTTGTTATYQVDGVNLSMAGYWEITVTVTPASGDAETFLFAFCVEG
ncbi:MAG TPA: FixH family protein [Candidatus Nanopelagicales bacterium]|nr:FixH family protein [Candidatus Nanopelagicales bacterium]